MLRMLGLQEMRRDARAHTLGLTSKWTAMTIFVISFGVTAASKPPAPQATGHLDWPQTYLIDFEKGKFVPNQKLGADLWFEATEPGVRFLTPVDGAGISSAEAPSTSHGPRDYPGCAAATYSTTRVSLSEVPAGSWVCVRTRTGNIAQFRLNSIIGDTLKIGFTTWKKPALLEQQHPLPPPRQQKP
jgi:hypothetical protein